METTDDMIRENFRRLDTCRRKFDPLTGEGSTGERFRTVLPDGSAVWLPDTMRGSRVVEGIASGKWHTGWEKPLDLERCRHDFPYWAAKYVYIKRKGGGDDVRFVLNRPQRMFVERLERMRLGSRPVRLILLKARQWGGSTCSQLYMAWLQLVMCRGLNSLIIAHQGVGSDEIKDMFDRMMDNYPEELLRIDSGDDAEERREKGKKMESVGKSRSIFRVVERNCKVKVGTAERPDSCRGGDYNLVHCSEVGIWKKTDGKSPEDILRSACSGILYEPMTMIVYESTANGTGNFFHCEYEAAKRGISQFEAMFVSWHDIDQYSLPFADDAAREAFARTLLDNRRSETSMSDREQPGAYLWRLWEAGATLEAINWYVAERRKYSEHGLMAAEYPSDDVEAFVHSGARVFDRYRVEALRPSCRAPLYRGEIDGDGFQPLASGGWHIWKMPEDSAGIESRYVAVVDVGGRSAKADWSVIVVFDRAPIADGELPEVVAQWRGHTDFDLLTERAAHAARFYSEALLVVESNTLETHESDRDTDGDQSHFLLNRLRDSYPNLYARRQSEEAVVRGLPLRYGFHTNMATKPMIIATLVKVIREGMYVERDQGCLDEYLSYERRQNGSYGAIAGCHDDMLMTRAIGLHIIYHEMEAPVRVLPMKSEFFAGGRHSGRRPVGYAAW